jgi:hypothetical protein
VESRRSSTNRSPIAEDELVQLGDLRGLNKPRATVDRQLQALHMLDVLDCDEYEDSHRGQLVTIWRYRLADGIDPNALNSVPEMLVHTPRPQEKRDLGR